MCQGPDAPLGSTQPMKGVPDMDSHRVLTYIQLATHTVALIDRSVLLAGRARAAIKNNRSSRR